MLHSKILKFPHRPTGERVSWYLKTSPSGLLPQADLIPNSFVSLFAFYILPYLLSKRMDCLSGCLVSSVSVQRCFVGFSVLN